MIWWDLWRKSHAINRIIDRTSICSFLIGFWILVSPGFNTPVGRLSRRSLQSDLQLLRKALKCLRLVVTVKLLEPVSFSPATAFSLCLPYSVVNQISAFVTSVILLQMPIIEEVDASWINPPVELWMSRSESWYILAFSVCVVTNVLFLVPLLSLSLSRPFPSEDTALNEDDVYRSLEELAE